MSNRLAFQTQLASIMEVLANAAVVEICKLVDDDYAVISLQMSQCQRENKVLKRKLHLLELRMARGSAERRIRENSLSRSSRVQVNAAFSHKYSHTAVAVFTNQDGLYRRQLNENIWRDRDSAGAEVPSICPSIKDDENKSEDVSKSDSESLLVKSETSEETPQQQQQQQLFIREDGVTEVVCEPGQTDFVTSQMDKVDDQHPRTQHSALEVSGSAKALKSEPRFENAEISSQNPSGGGEGEAQFGLKGVRAHSQELFVLSGEGSDPQRPSCSYVAGGGRTQSREVIDVDGDGVLVWDGPETAHHLDHFNSALPGLSYPGALIPEPSAWQQQPKDSAPYQPRHQRAASEKLFSCKFCGKAFNRPKKVEIHQRIHTGEKPFRCNTCGKFFAEAGNLKKHQKVHTGERPYSCSQCGKSFAWIRNLKTHQQKYHPDIYTPEELWSRTDHHTHDAPCHVSQHETEDK